MWQGFSAALIVRTLCHRQEKWRCCERINFTNSERAYCRSALITTCIYFSCKHKSFFLNNVIFDTFPTADLNSCCIVNATNSFFRRFFYMIFATFFPDLKIFIFVHQVLHQVHFLQENVISKSRVTLSPSQSASIISVGSLMSDTS